MPEIPLLFGILPIEILALIPKRVMSPDPFNDVDRLAVQHLEPFWRSSVLFVAVGSRPPFGNEQNVPVDPAPPHQADVDGFD